MRSNKYDGLLFHLNHELGEDSDESFRRAHKDFQECVGLILEAKEKAKNFDQEFLDEVFFQLVINSASKVQRDGVWTPFFRQLLTLLADPKVGPRRFFRCDNCGTFQIGRKGQRFCTYRSGSTSCRVQWHYKQNPEKGKARVKKWREKNPGMG